MRHYEIVFLVHPDQDQQLDGLVERYRGMIKQGGGKLHRFENWGRRQLAYPINKLRKAHYILMNIECQQETLDEIENNFRFNESILRHLTLRKDEAITKASPMTRGARSDDSGRGRGRGRERDDAHIAAANRAAPAAITEESGAAAKSED